jgi:hypothetical protein
VAASATARQAAAIIPNLVMIISPDESEKEHADVSDVPGPSFLISTGMRRSADGWRHRRHARQPSRLRGVVGQELEMSNSRPNLLFFALIAASLCAAVVLIGLLVGGDVAGPRVAINNLPPHAQPGDRQ